MKALHTNENKIDEVQSDFISENNQVSTPLLIQPKLSVGAMDDPFEHEADEMADRVMRMPETTFLQRKCAACEHEEEEQIQRKITPFIQKQDNDSEGGTVSESVTNQINASRGGGSRMSENTLNFMESRFNTDFSGVKIHTDSNAVQMSHELNAQAFTVGSDIYFNEGKYSPESSSGRHLLAHELTHTVQQNGGTKLQPKLIQRQAATAPKSLKDCINAGLSAFGVETFVTDTAIAICGLISVVAGIAGAEAGVVPPALAAAALCLSIATGIRVGILTGVLINCVRNRNSY